MIANYIIYKEVDKGNFVLDVGCGRGLWRTDEFIVGIDILKQKIEHYSMYLQHNLEKGLPKLSKKYDLVIAKDIIEHLHNSERLVKDIYKVMKRNGTFIVKVPDYKSKNAWGNYQHKKPYTRESIQALLRDNGFKIKKVVRLGGYFFPMIFPQAMSWLVVAKK